MTANGTRARFLKETVDWKKRTFATTDAKHSSTIKKEKKKKKPQKTIKQTIKQLQVA